ncbi:MAG: hypothetical protein KJO78_07745 [Alphaproteobacteria bacterium]|nr:hypothetical protein [Alphaproteobacteria bacterium]
MGKVTDLGVLFTIVAIVEFAYAGTALLIPPSLMLSVTGWVLSPDGQWIVKLIGAALLFQGLIAWIFRKAPHIGVAWALALYQIMAATIDWMMWIALADDGIFSTGMAQFTTASSVVLHYALGILLIIAIRRHGASA